jgi:RNA polymerase-binding transcription factor
MRAPAAPALIATDTETRPDMTTNTNKSRRHPEQLLDIIRMSLDVAATSRQRRLDDMAAPHDDPVVGAHRDSLERTLAEIRAAQERLDAGGFGTCQGCGGTIPVERLELRPWTPHCVACAASEGT